MRRYYKKNYFHLDRIVFSKDWKETLYGYLDPGEEVLIEYDASRLPNRDTKYGKRAWNIFAEFQYSEGGKVHSVLLDGPDGKDIMRTTLDIPSNATSFIIWFKHHGYYNGYSYDSHYGENYKFPFTQIVFTGDSREYVVGALIPGEKFQIVYDSVRLPWRDIGYLGRISFTILSPIPLHILSNHIYYYVTIVYSHH